MKTKKVRRHSGRYTPRLHSKMKYDEMKSQALEPKEEYDSWRNFRDGLKDFLYLKWKNRDKQKKKWKKK